MRIARADRGDAGKVPASPGPQDLNGRQPRGLSVVTQLTIGIPPPGAKGAVVYERESVASSGGDVRDRAEESDATDAKRSHRKDTVRRRVVAKLAVWVIAPAPHAPVGLEGDAVPEAGRDLGHC